MNPPIAEARDDSEDQLLRQFAAGQPAACRRVERYVRAVVFYRGFGLSAEERDDVVQDTLAALWQLVARRGFRLERNLRALARTVASARVIDRLRRRRAQVELDETLPDASAGPLEQTIAGDESARLRVALMAMGAACLELIRLHFFEGLTYGEIARREERNESTLRVRMFQCLQSLRKRMARAGA
jgi:RNA polymerase sigma-70 factor (ECF subfamily)